MATREQNKRRFPQWEELPEGGRRYWRTREGKGGSYARYVKIVDTEEVTVSIVQEVYSPAGRLVSLHQKYPSDTGHRVVSEER